METLVPFAVWAALIISGLSLAALLLFGIRSLASGKVNPISAAIVLLPLIVAALLGLALGDWAQAAILATLVVLVLAAVALLLTGIRGIFS